MTACDLCRTPIPDATVEEVLVSPGGIYCAECWKWAYVGGEVVRNPTREDEEEGEGGQTSLGFL
jgi:hypothetical protein